MAFQFSETLNTLMYILSLLYASRILNAMDLVIVAAKTMAGGKYAHMKIITDSESIKMPAKPNALEW